MKNITSRLKAILNMLLNAVAPVPVKDLASELRISRRTVFRELANTEPILHSFDLSIGTKPGEGIFIAGETNNREDLRKTLKRMGGDEPIDRLERQARLMVTLLQSSKLEKFIQYAGSFGVSAATISNDLDDIESKLGEYDLELIRKTGSGISISGEEIGFRRALLGLMHDWPHVARHAGLERDSKFIALLAELDAAVNFSKWMTPHSKIDFESYLVVMANRIGAERRLSGSKGFPDFRDQAEAIADFLQERLGIGVDANERDQMALEMAAHSINADLGGRGGNDQPDHLHLAHRLIEGFDSELAPLLKLDDALVQGIVSYLRPALVRLRHHIELHDSLAEQMSAAYPEVIGKTRDAAQALENIGKWLPDAEVCLLATHFCAAVSRVAERMRQKRDIRIGIVCVHGMGTSYLLASQVRKFLKDEAKIEVGSWDDCQGWRRFDFLISMTPIANAGMPVVVVPLILTEEHVKTIRDEIARQTFRKEGVERRHRDNSFIEHCKSIENLMADARQLLFNFKAVPADKDIDFGQLARLAAANFGSSQADAPGICDDLVERERVTTQVMPELRLVFLHCRTDGVASAVFGMIAPKGGEFLNPYFRGAKACIVMLIPRESTQERLGMMGGISAEIINDADFLAAILGNRADQVRIRLEGVIGRYLSRCTSDNFEGGG